mmetsp:Transcript_19844/g.46139  ORF Transcript_19844/g.46139 Transcript_19844/m.46139 type:complete len:206 (+) Transcript_19844:2251-2868(+)
MGQTCAWIGVGVSNFFASSPAWMTSPQAASAKSSTGDGTGTSSAVQSNTLMSFCSLKFSFSSSLRAFTCGGGSYMSYSVSGSSFSIASQSIVLRSLPKLSSSQALLPPASSPFQFHELLSWPDCCAEESCCQLDQASVAVSAPPPPHWPFHSSCCCFPTCAAVLPPPFQFDHDASAWWSALLAFSLAPQLLQGSPPPPPAPPPLS